MLKKEGKQFYKQVDFVLVEIVILCVCVYTYIHMCIYVCRCQFLTSAAMFGLWGSSWLYLVWAYFDILWVVYFSYKIRI